MSGSDPLMQPFNIRHVRFRNRVMSTSHASGLEQDGLPADRYQLYHEEKARGGIALTMFGGSSNIAPDSPSLFRQLNVGNDAIIPHFQRLAERIHKLDTRLMVQITHIGRRAEPYAGNWLPPIAPSPIRETLHRAFPKEMDEHDIKRVVEAFGRAARRCKEGGLDGLEVMTGPQLLNQFLSPRTNRRTDRFGGSVENRCRFALMVFEEIRRQVGDDFLVGIRYTIDEGVDGLSFEQSLEIARILKASGYLDFFNAIYGRTDTEIGMTMDGMPGMGTPVAPWLKAVGLFRQEIGLPVFHACRISDIATARYAIREGLLDMAAMTRPHIADPHIVAKVQAGQEDRIRPCVGATHCQAQYRPTCLHNPSTGRESVLPHVIPRSDRPGRRVVVIGGGPAGLEAARVAAERGHSVVLFEAASLLGGQVRLAVRTDWRRDLIGIVDWRASELGHLGVDVRLNAFADVETVLAETPDVVVVATGGVPDIDWLPGVEHVTSVWDALTAPVRPGTDILVYDGTGRHPALQFLDRAGREGARPQLVSIDAQIGQDLVYAERVMWKKRIYEAKLPLSFDCDIRRVERRGNRLVATFRHLITGEQIEHEADQVVVEHGTIPSDELYQELRGLSCNDGVTDIDALLAVQRQPRTFRPDAGFELHRVGDAVASRNIHTAILDSLRICTPL